MVLCIIAAIVFAVLSIFSAKYRPLAKEGLRCVFRTITLKPCDTGLDDRIKAELVSGIMKYTHSPFLARFVNRRFVILSWLFVILSFGSFGYLIYGVYNFYTYGNCDGPTATGACILNSITGDYGRFSSPKDLIVPTKLDGITVGNASAKNVVIEFGCFSCPYTKNAEPIVQQLLKEYNESLYYVFKPFPLPNHQFSSDAARAVLCANKQDRQWELRAKIFQQQEACSANGTVAIKSLAQDAGLNMTKFDSCFDNNETGAELAGYVQEGADTGVYATPTFFVNGNPIIGPKPVEEFRKYLK
ncbi:thioredoxin domain-containing protein [Candidatus Micrarchaeota archaeon]|nr:thioredoxin domain-containing protein [Candidatus Micrarchaeota archaeon]